MIGSDAGPGSPGGNRTAAAPVMISISTQTSPDVNAPLSTAVGAEAAQPLAVGKKEVVSYSVGVQTSEEWMPQRPTDDANDLDRDGEDVLEGEDGVAGKRSSRSQKRMSRRDKDREEELRQNLRREIEEEFKAIKDPTSTGAALATGAVRFPARALTVEESKAVTSSDIFLDFVDRSSKVIERALDDEYDLLADYATNGVEDEDSAEEDGFVGTRGRGSRKLKEVAQFYDEKWSKRRMISDLNFSPKVLPAFSYLLASVGILLMGDSFLSFLLQRTPRMRAHHKNLLVLFKFGTAISSLGLSIVLKGPPISSQPSSRLSIPP